MNLKSVIVAPDKFRGTISAREFADGITAFLTSRGVNASSIPLSDGGEGFLEAFSGEELVVDLEGPLGQPIRAKALLQHSPHRTLGIVESAEVLGRHLVIQPSSTLALEASSAPLGALLLACSDAGATEVLIGLGGSATSDGGRGVFGVLSEANFNLPMTIAADVDVPYLGALKFAQQKGVAAADLPRLEQTLLETAASLTRRTGIDPTTLSCAGAAGGVGGALLALGATAVLGAPLVAEACGLTAELDHATMLITGEGALDATSLHGKVVGHLVRTTPVDCSVIIIAGTASDEVIEEITRLRPGTEVLVLDRSAGTPRALDAPLEVATQLLDRLVFSKRSV